jgi:hypothetical protein
VVLRTALVTVAGLVAIAAGTARPALGYVRARTDSTNVPYFWRDPRVILELATPPDGIGISASEFRTAATAAVNAWSKPTLGCTEANLTLTGAMVEDQIAKRDGHDRIILRTGAWCRDPAAMTDCHADNLVALTTSFVRNSPGAADDGQILEADIEVNSVYFSFALIPSGPVPAGEYHVEYYDLTSALTHEAGHFLGLAHDCRQSGEIILVDEYGVAAPDCSSAAAQTAAVLDDTMYPVLNPLDVTQRTLAGEDVKAACDIYPLGSLDSDTLQGNLGCAVAPARPSGALGSFGAGASVGEAAAAALAAQVVRLRQRRRSRGRRLDGVVGPRR